MLLRRKCLVLHSFDLEDALSLLRTFTFAADRRTQLQPRPSSQMRLTPLPTLRLSQLGLVKIWRCLDTWTGRYSRRRGWLRRLGPSAAPRQRGRRARGKPNGQKAIVWLLASPNELRRSKASGQIFQGIDLVWLDDEPPTNKLLAPQSNWNLKIEISLAAEVCGACLSSYCAVASELTYQRSANRQMKTSGRPSTPTPDRWDTFSGVSG